MHQATTGADAASLLFDLPGYVVLDVRRDAHGGREVFIATEAVEAACPGCGVLTSRVHQRTVQGLRDVPFGALVAVRWVKKRWRCTSPACATVTFTEHTTQVPPFSRVTQRLKEKVVAALATEVRAVERVGREYGLSWPTVMRQLTAAVAAQAAKAAERPKLVPHLGIDEHRFRTVRYWRDEHDTWRRIEPWMITFTNLDTG